MKTEVWTSVPCWPRVAVRSAVVAERQGWDGVVLADSQNLAADVLVELGLCMAATSSLLMGPGVTNPATRHPAVLAGAMATLQSESGGRMVLGLGRGDSALAHLGRAPVGLRRFEQFVRAVQGFLGRDEVGFDEAFLPADIAPAQDLGLADRPATSKLQWLRSSESKVPLDIAATGPKVIDMAAATAERITFTVGASVERLTWATERVRVARGGLGLPTAMESIGAYVNIAVDSDIDRARHLVGSTLGTFSRFSVMHGSVTEGATARDRDALEALHVAYDMNQHSTLGATHLQALDAEYVDRNAIIGSPARCIARLRDLREIGIDRFILMALPPTSEEARNAHARLVAEVLPVVKDW